MAIQSVDVYFGWAALIVFVIERTRKYSAPIESPATAMIWVVRPGSRILPYEES